MACNWFALRSAEFTIFLLKSLLLDYLRLTIERKRLCDDKVIQLHKFLRNFQQTSSSATQIVDISGTDTLHPFSVIHPRRDAAVTFSLLISFKLNRARRKLFFSSSPKFYSFEKLRKQITERNFPSHIFLPLTGKTFSLARHVSINVSECM